MKTNTLLYRTIGLGVLFGALNFPAQAVDSVSAEFGSGDKTKMLRAAAQWKWEKQWWKSNGTHIGGYWNLDLAHWRGNKYQNIEGRKQNLFAIGLTPVFRFQRDSRKGPYAELGIGGYFLSELYDNNDQKLSTRLQFGDHLGAGYVFQNGVDISLKFQHFSNGGFKKPNSGVDFLIFQARYPLD
ncbi:acyloxyacyl hydrolase [Noviherbaspirillum sp.]|uniref:acyloxyacyl hydrolase n=1 Tax=Noviherbaspirillum sp. TaxID=1926288 RepID=UPI002FE1B266